MATGVAAQPAQVEWDPLPEAGADNTPRLAHASPRTPMRDAPAAPTLPSGTPPGPWDEGERGSRPEPFPSRGNPPAYYWADPGNSALEELTRAQACQLPVTCPEEAA